MGQVDILDNTVANADWTKQAWDLPPYLSREFLEIIHDVEAFRKLPVYKNAVANGLIHDDEWVGDYVEQKKSVKKSFTASGSATSGLTGYSLEGQKKPNRWRQSHARRGKKKSRVHLTRLLKAKRRKEIRAHTWEYVSKHEVELAGAIHNVMRKESIRIANKIRQIGIPKKTAKFLVGESIVLKASSTEQEIDDILDKIDLEGFAVFVGDELTDDLQEAFEEAAMTALKAAGIETDKIIVNHVDERALEYAQDRGAELVGKKWVDGGLVDNPDSEWSIDETTRDDLKDLISEAVENGSSTDDLADQILESTDFSEARAEMIARTELAFAHVAGNVEGWKQSGVVNEKKWIVGAGCCDECEELDGEIVDIDDVFSSGDDGPPAHPNCRCDVIAIVSGEDDNSEDTSDSDDDEMDGSEED